MQSGVDAAGWTHTTTREHSEPSAPDKREQAKHDARYATLEYAGLLGTGDHKVTHAHGLTVGGVPGRIGTRNPEPRSCPMVVGTGPEIGPRDLIRELCLVCGMGCRRKRFSVFGDDCARQPSGQAPY
jgi:hypothetical protein